MCIMFVKPGDVDFPTELVIAMRNMGNPDGAGVMAFDDGNVIVDKIGGPTKDDEVIALYDKYKHLPLAFHLRNQTLGDISKDNAHPYPVTIEGEDGAKRTVWMMHNGTIPDVQITQGWSDSRNYAVNVMRPLLIENPNLLDKKAFMRHMSALLRFNKLIFLDNRGKFTIVNGGLGRWFYGCWVSTDRRIAVPKSFGGSPVSGSPLADGEQSGSNGNSSSVGTRNGGGDHSRPRRTPDGNGSWIKMADGKNHFICDEGDIDPKVIQRIGGSTRTTDEPSEAELQAIVASENGTPTDERLGAGELEWEALEGVDRIGLLEAIEAAPADFADFLHDYAPRLAAYFKQVG